MVWSSHQVVNSRQPAARPAARAVKAGSPAQRSWAARNRVHRDHSRPTGDERTGCLVGFRTQCSIDPVRFLVCLSVATTATGWRGGRSCSRLFRRDRLRLRQSAALGDLDAVRGYFDPDSRLRAGVAPLERIGAHGRVLAPELVVECALIWAAAHDCGHVVEFLRTKDPDLRVTEPCFHATALGAARYHGRDAMVALLEPRTPPV